MAVSWSMMNPNLEFTHLLPVHFKYSPKISDCPNGPRGSHAGCPHQPLPHPPRFLLEAFSQAWRELQPPLGGYGRFPEVSICIPLAIAENRCHLLGYIYIIIFIHGYHNWFIVLETYLPIYPSTHLAIWLSTYLPIYLPIHLSICHSVRLSIPDLSDIYPTYKALFSVSNWFQVPRSSHEGNGKILSRREESAGILTRNDFVRIMDGRYITPANVTGTTI